MSTSLLGWIVLLPFAGAAVLRFLSLTDFGQKIPERAYAVLGIVAPLLATLCGFAAISNLFGVDSDTVLNQHLFSWVAVGEFKIGMALMMDRLSGIMTLFVTFIGLLIHIYATGYMKGDEGFAKFFSYFNFFLGSMLLLVLADNPVMLFVGWELVGFASYLLIGYYFKDAANMKAANKAFILNRIGDFGFVMGLSILFVALEGQGFDFAALKAHAGTLDVSILALVGMLLFVGAMGKSAQIPLYVWLPDAMAGPTPVSALIHAATMVTAGVYMVARFSFLYVEVPQVGEFIATIGVISALFAAIIACYQSDIKKILAYSTMSQLGYMFVGVGLGMYSSGIFHVFTHAFFKALLFMGAGAVIIALHHEQNIFKMGGLKKALKPVYVTMLVATLAISGIPPFAGFFSKDAILATAFASENYLIWLIGTLTAMLTAYYMFRMIFIVFWGGKEPSPHLHALPSSMIWPLFILAFGSVTAGWLGINEAFGGGNWFASFLALPDVHHHLSHGGEYALSLLNTAVAFGGIALAYRLYAKAPSAEPAEAGWRGIVMRKFYVDELYELLFVRTLRFFSRATDRLFDRFVFDGMIGFSVYGYRLLGRAVARLHNGNIRLYALLMLIGVSLMSLALLNLAGSL